MKKQLFTLSFALSASFCAHAQLPSTQAPTHADTVQAVHKLFSKHRTGGVVWTVIGAAFAGRIIGAAAGGEGDAGSAAAGALVLGGIPAGIGIGKTVRFSTGRESTALSAYQAGKPLPTYVRRRLKKKYFTSGSAR